MLNTGFAFHEQAYDSISPIYEAACAEHHIHILEVLSAVSSRIPPGSKVLDVGNGTGRPVAKHFIDHGHCVTGIDLSQGMVDLARKQVPTATFIKAEMTSYEPPRELWGTYDLVFASHSLYNISVAQLRTMFFKFARWVKKDTGLIVVGSSYRPDGAPERGVIFDHRGWSEGVTENFLGHKFDDMVLGYEDAWVNLMKETGVEVLEVMKKICTLEWEDRDQHENQFYLIAKKGELEPLLGPYPVPAKSKVLQLAGDNLDAWLEVSGRISERQNIVNVSGILKENGSKKVLLVAPGIKEPLDGTFEVHRFPIDLGPPSTEKTNPISAGEFDSVVVLWSLQLKHFSDLKVSLKKLLDFLSLNGNTIVIIVQASPDNELLNLLNDTRYNLTSQLDLENHGLLLQEARNILKASGFKDISFTPTQSTLSFSDIEGRKRVEYTAELLSKMWCGGIGIENEVKANLLKSLAVQFLFRPEGNILNQGVIMVAKGPGRET
ncbi:hypothetical protein M422DRAFT_260241 [Sphaerobolus stellatus SS14]|uniref:Methyltransferase domain-containing protein n=1 Tax=Sphaerobolus stellatus (strain SS14) TaxID=990650 RepID=A0A0C9VIE2_SPHS4|nr:hypothetical protein M422DRAFT_260241 [Sphaerobolus stellatus SS14]